MDPLRADLLGRPRHRARAAAARGERPAARAARAAARRRQADRAPTPGRRDGRPDARRGRGADELRPQGGALGVRARPRPRAAPPRARDRERRHDQRRGRDLRAGRPAGRGGGLRELGLRAGRGLEPDRARDRHAELHGRARDHSPRRSTRSRPRSAISPDRGPRGAGAVRRGSEGLERDAPQAEPRPLRAHHRARAGDPGEPAGGAREHRALARARHLALVGRARDPARLDDGAALHARRDDRGARGARGVPRADAREPPRRRRAGVLAERAARARRRGAGARRGVRDRPDGGGRGVGRGRVVPRPARRGRPRARTDRRPARRAVRPGGALRNLDVVFDRLEKVEVREG